MIVDVNGVEIVNPDLTEGFLVPTQIIKHNAEPINNVTKFAYSEDDYIDVLKYVSFENIASAKLDKLKEEYEDIGQQLASIFEKLLLCSTLREIIEYIIENSDKSRDLITRKDKIKKEIDKYSTM